MHRIFNEDLEWYRRYQPKRSYQVLASVYIVFVVIVCTLSFIYVITPLRVSYRYTEHMAELYNNVGNVNDTTATDDAKLKYILQWNSRSNPFDVMEEGQTAFYKLNCEYKNCFVTNNRYFFDEITKFHAIAFAGNSMSSQIDLPQQRSPSQKYIFGATESAHNYRICDPVYDEFFNWTWTYRLDSDIRWGYITIYDLQGHVVGPKTDMTWPELAPVSDELKKKLDSKTKMVAWFVSNCHSLSRRENFVMYLHHEASFKYGWSVDIYGHCGTLQCPRDRKSECFEMIQKDYFFYLSFENSYAQDYVTEKLLTALNNNAIPVVLGSANYSRFLPPGSYLDARQLGPAKLAETMDAIAKNKTRYYEFFRWKNHFKYKETFLQDVCNLCTAMNNKEAMNKHSVYKGFRRWWNDEQWDGTDETCRAYY